MDVTIALFFFKKKNKAKTKCKRVTSKAICFCITPAMIDEGFFEHKQLRLQMINTFSSFMLIQKYLIFSFTCALLIDKFSLYVSQVKSIGTGQKKAM